MRARIRVRRTLTKHKTSEFPDVMCSNGKEMAFVAF